MGSCLSKKSICSSSPNTLPNPPDQANSNTTTQVDKNNPQQETLKKEIFVIKHRKSHEIHRHSEEQKGQVENTTALPEPSKNATTSKDLINGGITVAAQVRTSSCTKEEVESILIQCGRLSRSSSAGKVGPSGSGVSCENTNNVKLSRKYSGSKRSYDFDNQIGDNRDNDKKKGNGIEGNDEEDNVGDDGGVGERNNRHRQRQRQSRSSPSPHGRRRTPSREREQVQQQQQRSGSRERGGNGGRRVSRSPGRRSESPSTTQSSGNVNNSGGSRPGKMVSVPATVSSLAMDKSNNGCGSETISAAAIKRIQLKRNVGDAAVGAKGAASPRARSPARAIGRASNENQNCQQQPLSLSRNNSRKAEQSPNRRNPLSEIDNNVVGCNKNVMSQKPNVENVSNTKNVQVIDNKNTSSKGTLDHNVKTTCSAKEQLLVEEAKGLQPTTSNVAVNVVVGSGAESFKPQALMRSRSSRRSRDLDVNPEALLNPNSSYTALLLEDIQNFHQKNTDTPAFSLPACVTKACSILEAVADLNSSTSSNLSCAIADNKRNPDVSTPFGANFVENKRIGTKDPFVESEVVASDDLMEPSFHKYVTVRRGTIGEEDLEEQESSGSNSFVGSQQNWLSPHSSWEPNSAESTDCWTSSRSITREDKLNPPSVQRQQAFSESGRDMDEDRKKFTGKKRESDHQQTRTGHGGRVGSSRVHHTMPPAAAST